MNLLNGERPGLEAGPYRVNKAWKALLRQVARPPGELYGHGRRQPGLQPGGSQGTGSGGDYRTARMPPMNQGLLDGQLAWRQHDGGHTDAPNMKYFIQWADRWMGRTTQGQ